MVRKGRCEKKGATMGVVEGDRKRSKLAWANVRKKTCTSVRMNCNTGM